MQALEGAGGGAGAGGCWPCPLSLGPVVSTGCSWTMVVGAGAPVGVGGPVRRVRALTHLQ